MGDIGATVESRFVHPGLACLHHAVRAEQDRVPERTDA